MLSVGKFDNSLETILESLALQLLSSVHRNSLRRKICKPASVDLPSGFNCY